ncbi:phytanoyl-CoA dioxygenase family protein [Rhodanobacter sp. DHB23]|uniref:phytanoyl-CoA dioxygenase family protein n=1 Tax=Rhodanobacter sp. DHB23 TaxID=2775923 RepID=UPI001784A8D2|nr:phytanoyl-CoA dioxygenase family protein [Rhodanobacter sp. DHB23]MBD8872206.1 phytanoyl-CoA dioxygenase family protein [Rhodanobacter sp. DHB23]
MFDLATLQEDGYALAHNALDDAGLTELHSALADIRLAAGRGGIRRIDQRTESVYKLARTGVGMALARNALGASTHFVRAIYFDKSPDNDWLVSWHQDRAITVAERADLPGWGPWSNKAGAWQVQPPAEWLERMVAVRMHLDSCDETNGGLKLIAGSHRQGLLSAERMHDLAASLGYDCPSLAAGDALVMRPLTVHASSRMINPKLRRVLHFEYCCAELPTVLRWAD